MLLLALMSVCTRTHARVVTPSINTHTRECTTHEREVALNLLHTLLHTYVLCKYVNMYKCIENLYCYVIFVINISYHIRIKCNQVCAPM